MKFVKFNLSSRIVSIFVIFVITLGSEFLFPKVSFAQTGLTNPALDKSLAGNPTDAESGKTFANYILVIWGAIVTIGGIAVLLYFVTGAVSWINAGGEEAKIKKARDQMTNAIIGMVILAASYVVIRYVGNLFGLNLLKFSVPTPDMNNNN